LRERARVRGKRQIDIQKVDGGEVESGIFLPLTPALSLKGRGKYKPEFFDFFGIR
jgi:hypothetical protein